MEIEGAFGQGGFTGAENGYSYKNSVDISDYINKGNNILKIETSDSYNENEIYLRNGSIRATLYVYGYVSL